MQDIHFEPKVDYVSAEWGYKRYFSSNNYNSRGVSILFNNNFEFKVKNIHKGDGGNYIMLTIHSKDINILLVNVLWTQQHFTTV